MEHAHVRQLEMKEQRKMKVESDFAQRQSKTEGLQQLEAERRERLLSARVRKEEAVKQKGEQIKVSCQLRIGRMGIRVGDELTRPFCPIPLNHGCSPY
jgi:hypothetical protein